MSNEPGRQDSPAEGQERNTVDADGAAPSSADDVIASANPSTPTQQAKTEAAEQPRPAATAGETPEGGGRRAQTVHRVRRSTGEGGREPEGNGRGAGAGDAPMDGIDYDLDGVPDQRWENRRPPDAPHMTPDQKASARVVTGGGRLTVGELERLEEVRSHVRPGDRYVRRVRPTDKGFRRVGPGHLEALPGTFSTTSGAGRLMGRLKKLFIGSPLSTASAQHERLTKVKALAVLSSDALSSVTYATEAILSTLVVAGYAAFSWGIPIAFAIAALIAIVVFSYRQTIYAYPKGGGTYIVSKDNLGTIPGLVGGSSLLVGYTLTVAVSIAAGVANLISLAAAYINVDLTGVRVEIALVAVIILVLLNLRGLREAGAIFSAPTYVFLVLMFAMLGLGVWQFWSGGLAHVSNVADVVNPPNILASVGPLLLMRAFASGCAALTGIEAISDGVAAFEKPESKNAATTLTILGVLLAIMFLGISFLAENTGVRISQTETVISQLGRTVFGPGPVYAVFLVFTALLLVLAANTAFADFPRLGYFLARDGFLPHQFTFRGDRLAFSFGIITLGFLAGVLIFIFNGNIDGLLPLYAIGVFVGFTLSQSGMVRRWWRLRPPGWQFSLFVNALGAATTALVSIILAVTKIGEGAWIVLVVVPLMVLLFMRINRHYTNAKKQVSLEGVSPDVGRVAAMGSVPASAPESLMPNAEPIGGLLPRGGDVARPLEHLVIMPVSDLNQLTLRTLTYARSLTRNVVGVHVASDEEPEAVEELEKRWKQWLPDVPLVIVDSPYRSLTRPLLAYIDALHNQAPERALTVMLPEFVARRWWEHLLHNQTALRLKGSLLFRPGIVVTSVPYHLEG